MPLDVTRESHIHCDASNEGLGWVLFQLQTEDVDGKQVDMHDIRLERDIITFGSTTLKDVQRCYSPVELEL